MTNTFHKDHTEKLIVILLPIDSAPSMTKLVTKPTSKSLNAIKRKREQPAKVFDK